jgi:hypothetical protein
MKLLIAIAAAMTLGSAVTLAADAAPPAEADPAAGKAACKADAAKLCANVEKGKGKRRECLEQHLAELSDACKAHLAANPKK